MRQVCSCQVKSVHAKSSLFMPSHVCSCQVKSRIRFVFGIPSVNKLHLGTHYTRRSVDSSLHLHSMYQSCIPLPVSLVCSCLVCLCQVCSYQVKSVHTKSSLFISSQVYSCQVKSVHAKSSLFMPSQVCSCQVKSVHAKSSLFMPSQVCSCQVKSRIRFVFGIPSVNKLHLGSHYTRRSVDS